MKTFLLLPLLGPLLCGCGEEKSGPKSPNDRMLVGLEKAEAAFQMQAEAAPLLPGMGGLGNAALDAQNQPAQVQAAPAPALPRKIIRSATIKVIVNDYDKAEHEMRSLLNAHKDAYISKAEISGSPGAPRGGLWTIRVPVAEFDSFVDALLKLGIPQKHTIDSKDVTEEYYDVQTRIKNKKIEEDRLVKHLEKSTGKLEEILKVESEISRVRGEIEQMEGRLRLMVNLSELTTVTFQIQEIKDYVPPQAPTFSSNIASTFSNSCDLLVGFGKNLVLVVVALTPWLPAIAIVLAPSWYFVGRRRRASQRHG